MKIDVNKMKIAMASTCMTLKEVCASSGVRTGTMNSIINGSNVRPTTVGKIARALGVPVTAILADEEDQWKLEQQQELTKMLNQARLVSWYTWLCAKLMQLCRIKDPTPDQTKEIKVIQKQLKELDPIIDQDKR